MSISVDNNISQTGHSESFDGLQFPTEIHFISGLPRSGSTLLSAILRQNPRLHATMSTPVFGLIQRLLEAMSRNELASFISQQQKKDLLLGVFAAYYQRQIQQGQLVIDTSRLWCAHLPLIDQLFPQAKVICCVRNVAWIMDSLERLVRSNPWGISGLFADFSESATVYDRTQKLGQNQYMVGMAYNALKEAYYGDYSDKLLLVEYDVLTKQPTETLQKIYHFLGEAPFEHNFNQVEYDEPEFDAKLGLPGLHKVRKKVEFVSRSTILPPDLFEKYDKLSFWLKSS